MRIDIRDDIAVLTIHTTDEESTVRNAVQKQLEKGYRVNAFDTDEYRALIFSAYKILAGFGVRRGVVAGKFSTAPQAAYDAARGLQPHFSRISYPFRPEHKARAS